MAPEAEIDEPPVSRRWRRGLRWSLVAVLLLVVLALALLWVNRREIAENVIADELAARGIDATYEIESIGGREQVLRDIVIGDPDEPDLTIERAVVAIRYRFGLPAVARVQLVRPRLHGTYRDGVLSFGALDPLLFTGEEGPFVLPDLRLSVVDGRALFEGDLGPVGIKIAGSGRLRGGFAGEIAAIAPRLTLKDCEATRATVYGRVSVSARQPAFEGPVRVAGLTCPSSGLQLAGADARLWVEADEGLAVFDGRADLRAGEATLGEATLAGLSGDMRFTWRDGGLTTGFEIGGTDLETPYAGLAGLELDGTLRARHGFERIELDADVAGRGARPGGELDRTLADTSEALGDTLLGPIVERVRRQLAAQGRDSTLAAEVILRRTGAETAAVVPTASLRGSSGETILSLSRFELSGKGGIAPRFIGNFATGGEGLPLISGRMERRPGGRVALRLSMDEYRAGASRLAIPGLSVIQAADGALGFAGEVMASGALPGGQTEGLALPVSGRWLPDGGLAMWDDCIDVGFDGLQLASLALSRQSLRLCPPRGMAVVRYGEGGLRIAAGAPQLALTGQLADTPIAIRSGPIGFAWPGVVSARRLAVTLGPGDTASTFMIDDLRAEVGNEIGGTFAGTDVKLAATPLDVLGASGEWRYAGGRLSLTDGTFRLEDRAEPDRFEPLVARGAALALEDNVITAEALLREPTSDRAISAVDLRHDLGSGRGHADLAVGGIVFDERLQPQAPASACLPSAGGIATDSPGLTCLALGVVNSVSGTVTGSGRIDWNESGVTSAGRFSSDSLDLAAPFGPVRGASGTVVFSDLLGLTTAPNQRIRVASINPGIEINDGEIGFELRGGELLAIQGGTWPFLGGTLTMRPIDLRLGASEVRRYVLEIVGLEAALFVQRMGLENISATGTFDGTIPLVFDAQGNGRLEGGLLLSRPPGGNVSYVGELTYEDLSPMANFAFDTLRSLDYRQMRVALDGSLTGEIVTQVRFDGVTQGEEAGNSLVSRLASRAVAGLPIRFDVNVRAPFYSLLSNLRSIYDPASVRDPRDIGLLDARGNVIRRETTQVPEPVDPADLIPEQPVIQRRESEELP